MCSRGGTTNLPSLLLGTDSTGLERGHGFAGLSMHGYKMCTAYVVSVVVPHNVNQTVPSLQFA
jgi:hypothetical protein